MNISDFNIPLGAGCYLFKDQKQQIIYVGKSKCLPSRVKSYFRKNHPDGKTQKLVLEICDVNFISTESETEALVLEEDLIKLYKPKFNIKGKDSRTIKSHLLLLEGEWPRLELVFPGSPVKGLVISEFTSGKVAKEIFALLHQLFSLRTCGYELSRENIELKKFGACLEWHLGRCPAPCLGLAKKSEYLESLGLIRELFKHNYPYLRQVFGKKMRQLSRALDFEGAGRWKEKLQLLGRIEVLLKPALIIKKRLRLEQIGLALGLRATPTTIDAFDNSHTSGTEAVCGMVRFTLLGAQKDQWRKFIIKSGAGGDDYGSFKEVLTRRFGRLLAEGTALPNLVILDGGRQQLAVGMAVFSELGLTERVDLIAISKDSRHRAHKIHTTSGQEIAIAPYLELSQVLAEVHRFSLDFHRLRRSKKSLGL